MAMRANTKDVFEKEHGSNLVHGPFHQAWRAGVKGQFRRQREIDAPI